MNSLVIILGILIIFLIYLLFSYLTSTATTVSSGSDFTQLIPAITGTKLPSPTNVSYAYGIWLYVQNWDPNAIKTIFYRPNNIKLYLNPQSPTLFCDITMNDNTQNTVMITNSFPLQKWVYIIISIDNQFIDCYLDGKLVVSQQLLNIKTNSGVQTIVIPKQPNDATTSPLYLGNSALPNFVAGNGNNIGTGWSATALLFTRWTTPVDPNIAWDYYMKGNGKSKLATILGSYGLNYSILRNNVVLLDNQKLF